MRKGPPRSFIQPFRPISAKSNFSGTSKFSMQYKQTSKSRLGSAKERSPLQKSFKMKKIENIYQIDEPIILKNSSNLLGRPPRAVRKVNKKSIHEDSGLAI